MRVGKEQRREDNSRRRTQLEQRLRSQGAQRAFLRLGVGGKEAVAISRKGCTELSVRAFAARMMRGYLISIYWVFQLAPALQQTSLRVSGLQPQMCIISLNSVGQLGSSI